MGTRLTYPPVFDEVTACRSDGKFIGITGNKLTFGQHAEWLTGGVQWLMLFSPLRLCRGPLAPLFRTLSREQMLPRPVTKP